MFGSIHMFVCTHSQGRIQDFSWGGAETLKLGLSSRVVQMRATKYTEG